MKVNISKTNNVDVSINSIDELEHDVREHKKHVKEVMFELSYQLRCIGVSHDWTKISYLDDFYNDVKLRKDEIDFKKRSWYDIHTRGERHHLNTHTPVDVNLLDVFEFIVDCVCAGKSRSGGVDYGFLEFDNPELLEKAYWNTVRFVDDLVELDE